MGWLEWFASWFYKENISHTADVLSIIGFVITIIGFGISLYVFVAIRNLKNFYVSKGRLPDLLKDLSEQSSNLSTHNQTYTKSKHDAFVEISRIETTLKALHSKVSKDVKIRIDATYKQIANYKEAPKLDQSRRIYASVQQVIGDIENLQKDQNWENNNV